MTASTEKPKFYSSAAPAAFREKSTPPPTPAHKGRGTEIEKQVAVEKEEAITSAPTPSVGNANLEQAYSDFVRAAEKTRASLATALESAQTKNDGDRL